MTTQTTQEIDELVAEKLGWMTYEPIGNKALKYHHEASLHYAPSDPRELFDLMVRYDVWPTPMHACKIIYMPHFDIEEPYTDHASKLEAATRVILRGVLSMIEGEKE